MWVAAALIRFSIPGSSSLKDRRQAVRSLQERLRARFGVACADLGPEDSWTRGALGVTACANEPSVLEEILDEVERHAQHDARVAVGSVEREIARFTRD